MRRREGEGSGREKNGHSLVAASEQGVALGGLLARDALLARSRLGLLEGNAQRLGTHGRRASLQTLVPV